MVYAIMNNLTEIVLGGAWTGLVMWTGRWTTTWWSRKGARAKVAK